MDVEDLYEEEKDKIGRAMIRLEAFEFGTGTETDKRLFEMAAKNEFGEAGFGCHVHWEEVVKRTALGDIPQNVWIPAIQDVHRLRDQETDHDKKQYEIVRGLDGGQPGYIREDGTIHEDPIKKIIT